MYICSGNVGTRGGGVRVDVFQSRFCKKVLFEFILALETNALSARVWASPSERFINLPEIQQMKSDSNNSDGHCSGFSLVIIMVHVSPQSFQLNSRVESRM